MRRLNGRRDPPARAGRGARRAARGARARGRRVCPLSRSSRSATSRSTSAATTGSSSRARPAPRAARGACAGTSARGSPRSGARRRRRSAAPTSSPRVSTQEGLLAELPRPAGRVLFAGAEDARRLLADELGADFVAALPHARLRPDAPARRRPRRARLGVRRARARRALGADVPAVSIGPADDRARREPRGVSVARRGADARPRRPRRRRGRAPRVNLARRAAPLHHVPDRLRPRRTTSSAPATA